MGKSMYIEGEGVADICMYIGSFVVVLTWEFCLDILKDIAKSVHHLKWGGHIKFRDRDFVAPTPFLLLMTSS